MKAFWASVAAAILIAIVAGAVLTYGVGWKSADVYRSPTGNVQY